VAEILKRRKALSVSPLTASQTIGAALAFLGFDRATPMLHGAQGCTAFGKVFFVRHFREPIPLQTTAMDQVAAVMGSEDLVVEGLRAICSKSHPSLVGVPAKAKVLQRIACEQVQIGDLEDLENMAKVGAAELLIGNSHALETASRLQVPLLRAGFPQYDQLGGYQRTWIGYRGTRRTLFELANMMLELEKGEIEPYRSVLAQKPEYSEAHDGAAKTSESSAMRH
jgi:nitrogenase molybdenum-iron protein alpha/beta subunit